MKQILQSLRDGSTTVADVPSPGASRGHLLIHTSMTLVSAGTERMLVEFGKANWLQKARQQPDKVKMVLDKMRTDGVAATLDAVQGKLDQPLALGYCNVGTVVEVGAGVSGFCVGDRVASNGKHAEVVRVPANLCARIPDAVADETAAFTVLAAIGLQGIRLANPSLGECVVVSGLGLIGLLTVQMLRAQGCRVLGVDVDPERLRLARGFGAQTADARVHVELLARADVFSRGRGVDAVIITASTSSNDPVSQAAKMCRKRGRIVLVGVTGLELSRADFYEKELSFQVSCSYGPGRYDPAYEEGGHDYPVGLVRWTEQRNFEAVLDMMSAGAVQISLLVSHRFAILEAPQAYALLGSPEPSMGIVLQYRTHEALPSAAPVQRTIKLSAGQPRPAGAGAIIFVGAGNYAGRMLIPAFKKAGAVLHTLVSSGGTSATVLGAKHGFEFASTDLKQAFDSAGGNCAVIATRHDAHASQVLSALRAGMHVFCEKPLCLSMQDLNEIEEEVLDRPGQMLMVGFNRRFSPLMQKMAGLLGQVEAPRAIVITVNAGAIPAEHWTQDPAVGGGRLVGEGCHFIDLARHLADAPITGWTVSRLGPGSASSHPSDSASIGLQFDNGSVATLHYLANGNPAFPKERIEVFCGARILQLDNFRKLRGWGWANFSGQRLWRQDKGQLQCIRSFMQSMATGVPAMPLGEILEASRVSIKVQEAMA